MKNNTAAIIQARMDSTRLPGKMGMKINEDQRVLEFMIERIQRSELLDQIIVATTTNPHDSYLIDIAHSCGVHCFTGSEDDVLGRVYEAAKFYNVDHIIDLTGDCPLIDGHMVDIIIKLYEIGYTDYVSNIIERTFPDGLDIQMYSFEVLSLLNDLIKEPEKREHVGWNVTEYLELFTTRNWEARGVMNWPELGITIDTEEDLNMIRKILKYFRWKGKDPVEVSSYEIIQLLKDKPSMITNQSIVRKTPGQGE